VHPTAIKGLLRVLYGHLVHTSPTSNP